MPHHKPMVPSDFTPRKSVTTDRFIVRPLLFTDAEPDYEAWSTSIEHLQGIFGPGSDWPTTEMTLDENTGDERFLGCIYFSPARKTGHEVEAFYWVRASEVDGGLDDALGDFVGPWTADAWQFESVIYSGRNITWNEYASLPDQLHW